MNSWINLHALWRIIVVGLLAGAGLPAIFAIGLRSLSTSGSDGATGSTVAVARNPAGVAAAGVCFAIVLAAIGYGIYLIVSS
jgi:hypothetical protein